MSIESFVFRVFKCLFYFCCFFFASYVQIHLKRIQFPCECISLGIISISCDVLIFHSLSNSLSLSLHLSNTHTLECFMLNDRNISNVFYSFPAIHLQSLLNDGNEFVLFFFSYISWAYHRKENINFTCRSLNDEVCYLLCIRFDCRK